jgi:hypothetical protein
MTARLGALCAFVLVTLAGCAGGGAVSSGPAGVMRAAAPARLRIPGTTCLADWNSPANAAVREGAVPPRGPYRLSGSGPAISPRGPFQAFVAASVVIGAAGTNPPPQCYVYFRFPHGYRGGPAMVSYPEVDPRRGIYGDPGVTTGKNTDVGGRVFVQVRDGRLQATRRSRRT